jgi:hypothetical protein
MGIIHNEDLYSDFLAQQIQGFNLTKVIINQELTGVFNTATLQDMRDILKRQIEAGDTEGFYKGIRKIFRIKGKSYDETDII